MRERRCQASYNVEVVCGGVLPHSGQGRMGHLSLSVKDVLGGSLAETPSGDPTAKPSPYPRIGSG